MKLTNPIKTSLTTILLGLAFSGCKCDAPKQAKELARSPYPCEKKTDSLHYYSEQFKNDMCLAPVNIWSSNSEDYSKIIQMLEKRKDTNETINSNEIMEEIFKISGKNLVRIFKEYEDAYYEVNEKGNDKAKDNMLRLIGTTYFDDFMVYDVVINMIAIEQYEKAEQILKNHLISNIYEMSEHFKFVKKNEEELPDSVYKKMEKIFSEGAEKLKPFLK
jgi:hypothetical protein